MPFFHSDQVRYHGPSPYTDHDRYLIDLPDISYTGKVLVPSGQEHAGTREEWVAQRLDVLATKLGYDVLCGRLYSPVEL